MAKIVDPDDLTDGVEVTITPGVSGTVTLNIAGNLSTDGITMQCLYSFLKERWKNNATYIKYPFPMIAITEEQFEFFNNWNFADTASTELVRDGGWAVKNPAGDSREEYMNVTTLGSFDDSASDRAYYTQASGSNITPTDIVLAGEVNQAVKIYGNSGYGNFDYRDYFKIFLREEGKTYDSYDLPFEQNLTALTYKKYAMPLSNGSDVKVTNADSVVSAGANYVNIDVAYYVTPQNRDFDGTNYLFDKIIEGDSKSTTIIYEKIQYLLRQPVDINTGAGGDDPGVYRGDIADELLSFVGDTLVTATGVYIDNFAEADRNSIDFYDTSGTLRRYAYVATGLLQFNDNLVNDTDAEYWMFFTSIDTSAYGTDDAILVQDADGSSITGFASASSIEFTFDYDNNEQPYGDPNNRTKGTDAPVTVVAIGLNTAQFVKTTATLERTKSNNISLVAALERNYSNP
jgi:hypothetical protein